ncbi:MAG: hypothetical protein AB1752_07205 [Candidatus Zixiibacteriota bacterium]
MINGTRVVLLALGVIVVASCASLRGTSGTDAESSPADKGITRTFGQPHDVVWAAVQEYMAIRQWPLGETNRDKGYIRSGQFTLAADRDYAHCRSGRRSSVTAYESEFEVWLTRISANGTSVSVTPQIAAEGSGRADCSSTGALEEELFAGVDSLIASRKP